MTFLRVVITAVIVVPLEVLLINWWLSPSKEERDGWWYETF
jgi:hypothetical protein